MAKLETIKKRRATPTKTRRARLAHDAALDEGLLERVVELTEIRQGANPDSLRFHIQAQARSYLTSELISEHFLRPSEGKEALLALLPQLANAEETIRSLELGQTMVLSAKLDRLSGKVGQLGDTRRALNLLSKAITETLDALPVKRGNPSQIRLENTIGALMLTMELASGKRPKVSAAPCSQTAAIVLLLMTIDPNLTQTQIERKISLLSRKYDGKPLNDFAVALYLPMQTVTPF